VLLLLVLLPYLRPHIPESELGRWFPPSGRRVQFLASLVILAWMALTLLELSVK
jgi:hypothetical protein